MKPPSSEDFLQISKDFYEIWNFPNTIGAIDGKHIRVKCPPSSGSMYYNYKNYFSIVLQAVVDAHYKFIIIDVGGYGKQSDGGTFRASELYKLMERQELNIPDDTTLPSTSIVMPFVFIADEAYPLLKHVLKPYSSKELDLEKEYFNRRLSRARKVVECAFGILNAKWRLLWKPIETSVNFVDEIVKCSCILHNTIIDLEGSEIANYNNEENNRRRILGRSNNRSTTVAQIVRDTFKTFVCRNRI